MRYTRLLLAAIFALCLAAAHAQQAQAQVCTLTVEQAPELRGFRLGMTTEEIRARFPGALVRQMGFGSSSAQLTQAAFGQGNADAYKGVNDINLLFLDDHLAYLAVGYDQTVPWKNAGQFAARVSEFLKLPDAWRDGAGNGNKVLTCAGFDVIVTPGINTVTLTIPGYSEVLRQRREQHEEKLRQDFRP